MLPIIPRDFSAPDSSFFLFGPRGCGKTTWWRNWYKNSAVDFDLLDATMFRELLANPQNLRKRVEVDDKQHIYVLDEIQRIPELLPIVHSLIVDYPRPRFVLTGSNARKLKREGVDLLAGRALLKHMHPFTTPIPMRIRHLFRITKLPGFFSYLQLHPRPSR
ncbi:MAG: AAA family ATPase [Chitinivibrionales bacterium]